MTRERWSLFVESALVDRVRIYARALARRGETLGLSGVVESALWEYLERRSDRMGEPRDGTSPLPVVRYPGPGRPTAAARRAQFIPKAQQPVRARRASADARHLDLVDWTRS